MITEERLKELERLEKAATEGPWERGGPWPSVSVIYCTDSGTGWPEPTPPEYEAIAILHTERENFDKPPPEQSVHDATFIAEARAALPDLISTIRTLRERVRELEENFRAEGIEVKPCQ